ncbi:uncharacterized protein LOC141538366 [Cotesia typhae]|uniref:uncharacterized protein LOC141538366 n=1 Tax=Cotesia typhae TaxID=2053667 RepID=UPI003D69C38F
MDNKSTRGVKKSNDKRVSSASEDSLNDFKTPPSTRASKLSDIKHSDNSPAVRSINSSFNNRPDENQPGPSNLKKPSKRPVSPPDDSLADFKSPKLLSKPTVKLLDKPKTRPKKSNRKAATKKDSNQMSIESSFFKPATSFPCPLCLKTFCDSASQIAHSKTCASKNKVSTRKLLEAVALQERQAEERRAIGLPAQPFAQPRRKSTFRRSDFRSEDPNVQLALALSESLQEAQNLEELDAAIALAGEEILLSSSQRQNTLKNFGFLTNKPAVEVTERPKKKKLNSQTVLQTRTQETRQRLLAERIAEVIVDNSDATCVAVDLQDDLGEIKLVSKALKEILEPGRKLWKGSSVKKKGEFYYVKNLEGFIAPCDPMDLDQGENSDPEYFLQSQNKFLELDFKEKNYGEFKSNNFKKIEDALESSEKILERSKSVLESAERSLKADCSFKSSGENLILNEKNSFEKEEIKSGNLKILEDKKIIEETPKKLKAGENCRLESAGKNFENCSFKFSGENFVEDSLILNEKNSKKEEIKIKETPKKLLKSTVKNSLANSWRKMLNSSDCSDVIILCEDDKFIYGHSVVFWTRCQFLYRDLVKIDQVNIKNLESKDQFKYQINWRDIDFFTALVFLEFIYCGYIEDLKVGIDKLSLLVQKYNYEELSEYLKNYNCKNESVDEEIANFSSPGNFKSNNTNLTMSPDIFEDEDSIVCDNSVKIEAKNSTVDLNSLNEEIDDKNSKSVLRRSSTCPDIEKVQSFSENFNDTLKKTRSELSVFLEKIQRRNARDILADSDDEHSFLPETKTNKFKKADQSLTDRYKNFEINSGNINLRRGSKFWAAKKSIEKPEKVVKKSALSIFEDDIREKVAKKELKNFENFESDEEIKDLSNLTQSFEINDPNVSMYTKYKLTHKDNSIAYYRNLIKDSESKKEIVKSFSQKLSEGFKSPAPSVGSNIQQFSGLCSQAPSVGSNFETEKDAILEDDDKKLEQSILSQKSLLDIKFDEDDDFVDEIIKKSFCLQKSADFKGYSQSFNSDKVTDEDDKISEGFKSPTPSVGSNSKQFSGLCSPASSFGSNFETEKDAILEDDDLVIEVDDKNVEQSILSQKSLVDIEFDDDDFEDDDFNVDEIIEKSFCLQKSVSKDYKSFNSDEVIDLDEDDKSVKDYFVAKEEMRRISTTNQIYLQELSRYDLYKPEDNLDEESVLDLTLSDEEKEDKSCKRQRSEDLVVESDEEIFSVKKKKNSTFLSQDIASQGKTITSNLTNILKECGVISPTPKSPISLSDDSRDSPFEPIEFSEFIFEGGAGNFETSTQVPSTSSNFRLRRSTTVSPVKNTRLLINKSKSTDFYRFKNKEEINEEEINKEEICNYLKLSKENVTVSLNVEQKVDYNLLSTPELNRKLNLYGLKNQKRHRAVKLLTYIYESLNPLVLEEIVNKKMDFCNKQEEYKWRIESLLRTDDEDDNIRISGGGNNDRESFSSELPEEMDLTDIEYDQKDLKSVKEAFGILLREDDDLHRKVLMYESLPLETLHGKIKDRGVKCSVSVLMDYLNEECISFYIEAPKKWSNGRRKPKKLK